VDSSGCKYQLIFNSISKATTLLHESLAFPYKRGKNSKLKFAETIFAQKKGIESKDPGLKIKPNDFLIC
jgi:hypothetical protein